MNLLPQDKISPQLKKMREPSTIANKLRSRGGFNKPPFQKDYDELTLETEEYKQFLQKKKIDR